MTTAVYDDFASIPRHVYNIVLADPPWPHYGDPQKDQAAGKHYALMSMNELAAMPVPDLLARESVLYLWATSPRLDLAFDLLRAWRLVFLGTPFVWAKTTKDGRLIHGQGVRPKITKPTTETVLAATTEDALEFVLAGGRRRDGRPLPVLDEGMPQLTLAPRPGNRHSAKPPIIQERIEQLHGPQRRIELFARSCRPGWESWGASVGSKPFPSASSGV